MPNGASNHSRPGGCTAITGKYRVGEVKYRAAKVLRPQRLEEEKRGEREGDAEEREAVRLLRLPPFRRL